MNKKHLVGNEPKIYICERILSMDLLILDVLGRSNGYQYKIDTFKKLNKMQRMQSIYLKVKYPRSSQSFVPGDLVHLFQEFNLINSISNDMLRNSGVYFADSSEAGVIRSIKTFFNKALD